MNFQPLKDFLDGYLPMLGIPGSDTVIYVDHKEVFRYQSGFDNLKHRTPVRADALYYLYSCTKVATCVAATQLIERGEILPNEPVYAYIPEYRDLKVREKQPDGTYVVRAAKTPMLVRHLLTMTSGLNYALDRPAVMRTVKETNGRAPTLDVVRAFAEDPLEFDPGTHYQYSLSLDAVAGLIEVVSGMKFGEYLKKNVFDPLGMTRSTFHLTPQEREERIATHYNFDEQRGEPVEISKDPPPYVFGTEYESGGAGLISCVDDMILLADALANFGEGKNGNRILSSYGVNLMRTNCLTERQMGEMQGWLSHLSGYGYGYGVRTRLDPGAAGSLSPVGEFGWDGAKLSYLLSDPEHRIAMFHAEHLGRFHSIVEPRLVNLLYSCVGS